MNHEEYEKNVSFDIELGEPRVIHDRKGKTFRRVRILAVGVTVVVGPMNNYFRGDTPSYHQYTEIQMSNRISVFSANDRSWYSIYRAQRDESPSGPERVNANF